MGGLVRLGIGINSCSDGSFMFVDFVFAVTTIGIGFACGWYLRGGEARRERYHNFRERQFNREVTSRLHELAGDVADRVHQHSVNIEHIGAELPAAADSATVVAAVTQLLESNRDLKEQLRHTQNKLHEQSRLLEARAADAMVDAMTGLANRRALDEEMTRRFAEFRCQGRILSLLLIDLDNFRALNDRYGCVVGDRVLRGVAAAIRQQVRGMDLVARYDEDELAIILPGTPSSGAVLAAERLRRSIEATRFPQEDGSIGVTVSVGVSQLATDTSLDALIQRADAALHAAKTAGRNRTFWHDGERVRSSTEKEPDPSAAERLPEQKPNGHRWAGRTSVLDPLAEEELPSQKNASPAGGDLQESQVCSRAEFVVEMSRLRAECRHAGQPFCIVLARIDRYDEITGTFGSRIGALLRRVTLRFLRAAVADRGIIGQIDDSTFGMLLAATPLADAKPIAEQVREFVARCAFPVSGDCLRFTVSLGGTEVAGEAESLRVMELAHAALKTAIDSDEDHLQVFEEGDCVASFSLPGRLAEAAPL